MQFAKAHIAHKIFLYLYEVIAKARVARKIFLKLGLALNVKCVYS